MECDLLTWTMLLMSLSIGTAQHTIIPMDETTYMAYALLDGTSDETSAPELVTSMNLISSILKETPPKPSKALSAKPEATNKPSDIVASRGPSTDEPSTTGLAHTTAPMAEEDPFKKSQATPANDVNSTMPSAIPPPAVPSGVPSPSDDVDDTTTDHNITTKHQPTSAYQPQVTEKDITQTTEVNGGTNQTKKGNNKAKIVLIVVIIIILVMLSIIMIILVIRKKRRSGSQTFHTQSRKGDRKDVWAGQVPDVEDGMVHNEVTMENGKSGNQQEAGNEMTTFVSGEKKADSVVEMQELVPGGTAEGNVTDNPGKEDPLEEKRPLLEGNSEGAPEMEADAMEDQFSVPAMEQELL